MTFGCKWKRFRVLLLENECKGLRLWSLFCLRVTFSHLSFKYLEEMFVPKVSETQPCSSATWKFVSSEVVLLLYASCVQTVVCYTAEFFGQLQFTRTVLDLSGLLQNPVSP